MKKSDYIIISIFCIGIFFITCMFYGIDYLAGGDSYYYLYELNHGQIYNLWLWLISFLYSIIGNYVIIANLFMIVIPIIFYFFSRKLLNETFAIILLYTLFLSNTYFNKTAGWLDTHIPVAIMICVILYCYLIREEVSIFNYLIIIISMFIVVNTWKGYGLIIGFVGVLLLTEFLWAEHKFILFATPFATLFVVALINSEMILSYLNLTSIGISELYPLIISKENFLLLGLNIILFIRTFNKKTFIILIYFLIPALIMERFNYFLFIVQMFLLVFQLRNHIFFNETELTNFNLIKDRYKTWFLICVFILCFNVSSLMFSQNVFFINDDYVNMSKEIKQDNPIIMTYIQNYFMKNYLYKKYSTIEYYDFNYTCSQKYFIEYLDKRINQSNYYLFYSSLDFPQLICKNDYDIESVINNEEFRGFETIKCVNNKYKKVKSCLFYRIR